MRGTKRTFFDPGIHAKFTFLGFKPLFEPTQVSILNDYRKKRCLDWKSDRIKWFCKDMLWKSKQKLQVFNACQDLRSPSIGGEEPGLYVGSLSKWWNATCSPGETLLWRVTIQGNGCFYIYSYELLRVHLMCDNFISN